MLALACSSSLGYGAENATWRNCYLMGALELRDAGSSRPRSRTVPEWRRA